MQVQVVRKWEGNDVRPVMHIVPSLLRHSKRMVEELPNAEVPGTYIAMVVDDSGRVLRTAEGRTEATARRQLLGLVGRELGQFASLLRK